MAISLGARLKYYDLDGKNNVLLKEVGKIVVPHLDKVLDHFYEVALAIPQAAEMFKDPKVLKHARDAQKRHWEHMFAGEFSENYVSSCARVGRTHHRIQLPFELYFSSYAMATSDLQRVVIKSYGRRAAAMNPGKLADLLGVMNRAFALDTDMVIQAFFDQGEELAKTFNYIASALQEMADGNLGYKLDHRSAPDFPKRYDDLRTAWNTGIEAMAMTIVSANEALENVRTSASRIESAADGLSTRTATQAASLEETSAAMQTLNQSVESTAKNTKTADQVSRGAREEVELGTEKMTNAAAAMERIQKASEEITKIISMIDDISFQTNLLALNAGVEAARAGEAGRGFAVVASEVRNLAVSSSDAAQQIKDLITRSSEEVAEGVELVGTAGQTLSKVAEQFGEVARLAGAVASDTTDQAMSLSEVTSAVNQMDEVTQQNAAMVEDSAHEIAQLVQQIDTLAMRLSHFKLDAGSDVAMSNAA